MRTVRVSMQQTLHAAAAARKIGRNRIQSTRAEFLRVTFLSVRRTERRPESRTMNIRLMSEDELATHIEDLAGSGARRAVAERLAAADLEAE